MQGRRDFLKSAGAFSACLTAGTWVTLAEAADEYGIGPIVHRQFPLNSEPRPFQLAAGFITPQSDFYIRNHGSVPDLAEDGYVVRVEVPGKPAKDLTLAEMKSSLPARSVTAVMQCAGNRRADMGKFRAVSGDAWRIGAIGNATWSGVGLGDVLRTAGIRGDEDWHVAFAAHDDIEEEGERFKFGVSIPLAKAMAPESMVAFEMNGEGLTREHGFPLRVVIPGYAGVRSPKWLASIKVQDHPSDNHIQQKEYKLFPPEATSQTVDLRKGDFINDMPMNSAICMPEAGAVVAAGPTTLRGWAISTGSPITRVEVSADRGRSWRPATLDRHAEAPWSWTPWRAELSLARGRHEVMVRAFNEVGESQPSGPAPIYNYPGYLSRAWHRIALQAA